MEKGSGEERQADGKAETHQGNGGIGPEGFPQAKIRGRIFTR
jgi:hypothetical protein